MENNQALLENNQPDTQNGLVTLGDFMSETNPTANKEVVTYEEFMGEPAPDISPVITPIPEEHKEGFISHLGKVFYGGMLKGISTYNNLLADILTLTPADLLSRGAISRQFQATYATSSEKEAARIREESYTKNKPIQFVNETIESFGNLGATLPMDLMLGGVTKIALAGKVLPAMETILSRIPDFALGSGWRGLFQGIEGAQGPVEGVIGGITGMGENIAINTLYASAGVGVKGIGNMSALGAANAVYEAAKEGRPPNKDELLSGAAQGAAYGIVFSILPHLKEATKIGAEKITLGKYETELTTHIKNGDLPKVRETVDRMLADETIRPEIKEAMGRALEQPTETPTKEAKPIKVDKGEGLYQKVVNRFQSIENIVDKARQLGATIKPGEDAGLSAERYLSIGNQARNTIEQGTFKITKEGSVIKTGEGLKPILDEYDKASPEKNPEIKNQELTDYLIAKRTVEDLQRPKSEFNKENIATPEQVKEAKETINNIKAKYGDDIQHLEKTATRLYDYQKRVLHLLVDSGNMSQEMYDNILTKNPNYVPFDRMLPTEETAGVTPVSKNRFTAARSPVKRIQGSELKIHNPIESMIKNTYKIMDIASRNKVWTDIYSLKSIPELEIKAIKPDFKPIKITKEISETASVEETIFRPSQFKPKGNVLEGYVNGKRKYIEVSKNLYDAMTGLNETSSNMLIKILSKPAQWLRVGATTTPEFILRNPIRDQWTALIQTSLGWKPFIDTGSAMADILKRNEVYNDWIRSGGSYAGFVELSRPRLAKMVEELNNKPNLLANLNILTKLGDLSQLMEQATRVGVYKAGVEKGLSSVEAAKQSREATVDFARRGSSTKDINACIAFFNAGIQGLDKTIRTAKKDPVGMTVKATVAITIPSLLLYLKNREDPEYTEIPRWQKDLFWMTKIGDTWVRMPKPFLYGQIFGSLPERFFEYLDNQDPQAFNDYGESLYNALSPISGDPMSGLLPTAVKPIIENITNYNFFRGRQIVSESRQRLLPSEQFSKYDTETAKLLGKILNVSPSKIENLIQGYTGGMGRYALQTGDLGINTIRAAQGKELPPKKPTELSDIPLVKGFVSRDITSGQSESVQRFYESRERINQLYSTYKSFIKSGDRERANQLKKSNPEMKYAKRFNRNAERFSDIEKQVDRVVANKEMNDQSKRNKIKELELRKIGLAKEANRLLVGK